MKFIQSEISFEFNGRPHKKRFKDGMLCSTNDDIMSSACQRTRRPDLASVTKSQLDNFFQKPPNRQQQQNNTSENPPLNFHFESKLK